MKLTTLVLSTALFFTTLATASNAPKTPAKTPEQCAGMYLEILDISYKHKVNNLEYEKNIHLYNAAVTILEKNSLMALHADDPEEFTSQVAEETSNMQASATALSKKIMGNESVLSVLSNEMEKLQTAYDNSSCGAPERVLEFAPAVCERIGKVNNACKFMYNVSPKEPGI